MTFMGLSDDKLDEMEASLKAEMVATAAQLRDLILTQRPREMISYLWHALLRAQYLKEEAEKGAKGKKRADRERKHIQPVDLEQAQFLFEYIHAALASSDAPESEDFDEARMADILKLSESLWMLGTQYCMISSARTTGGAFGDKTADVEFRAKSHWFMIRGHRYQTLEGEFYAAALAPHDDVCREIYGIGAAEIGAEMQAISDSMRLGHIRAMDAIYGQFQAVTGIADEKGVEMAEALELWAAEHPDGKEQARDAFRELFSADTGNLSKHTQLPRILLEDLAYDRGGNTEFFSPGALCGTPMRTLPVRIKPLIKLGDEFFAVDTSFVRDVSYRALLFHLLRRKPDYKATFESRQKEFSENAFVEILSEQTRGAEVYREVYYKDPDTGQWVENDTLLLLDDVLALVEAKSGANATIASPAIDFTRHVRDVQELVAKAYKQCSRFFRYLASAPEVPLYNLKEGNYVEVKRIRLDAYRLLFPIGLTVESFSPFSAMCKSLPDIDPILGKHPFISMSIDDLFVLKRLLPSAGEFFHYLSVRQAVAGIKEAHLYDEIDHLGSYISKNRFDMILREQLAGKEATFLMWDGFCKIVDDYFGSLEWEKATPPKQQRHPEVEKLLTALRKSNELGWLAADHNVRDLSRDAQSSLGEMLGRLRESLAEHTRRWFLFGEEKPLFVWVQRIGHPADYEAIKGKAAAAAIGMNAKEAVAVLVFAEPDGSLSRAVHVPILVPDAGTPEFDALAAQAKEIADRKIIIPTPKEERPKKLPGQNQPCWCRSGRKFKNCHGQSWGKH